MMTNIIDTEKLGSHIVEMKNLYTEWSAKESYNTGCRRMWRQYDYSD